MSRPKLRIGVVKSVGNAEEVISCYENLPNEKCDRPGFEVEIFDAIMHLLGWDYEIQTAATFGNAQTNGSWNGLIGMAVRDKIDASAVTMRVLPERSKVVEFSYPIWYYQQTYIYRRPELDAVANYNFHQFVMKPFQTSVWYALLITLLLAVFAQWFIFAVLGLRSRSIKTKLLYGERAFWSYASILLKQDYPHKYRFWSTGQLKMFWTCFCLVFGTYYQTLMYSLLAVPLQVQLPFLNCKQLVPLLTSNQWHLVYADPSVLPECTKAEGAKMRAAVEHNPVRTNVRKEMYGSKAVATYSTQYLDTLPYRVSIWEYDDEFLMVRDDTVTATFGSFMFAKNSTYRKRFDQALIQMMAGALKIKRRYPSAGPRRPYEQPKSAQKIYLSLDHLLETMYIWIGGMCLGLLFLCAELHYWPTKIRNDVRTRQRKAIALLLSIEMKLRHTK